MLPAARDDDAFGVDVQAVRAIHFARNPMRPAPARLMSKTLSWRCPEPRSRGDPQFGAWASGIMSWC